jgi:disulfide bond formation protein DsbB
MTRIMSPTLSSRCLALLAFFSLAGLAAALFSQHVLGMAPCAWCVLQRMLCAAIALVSLGGLAFRHCAIARRTAAGVALAGAVGGVVAALYQHNVAANQFSCDLSFADRVVTGSGLDVLLPSVFGIYATCAESVVDLLGIRYEFWSLMLFVLLGILALGVLLSRQVASAHGTRR